jgi:toxin ParE1/3/4
VKPLRWHPQARRDADDAAALYAEQGGIALELAFTDALEAAVTQIARHPGAGSSRYAEALKAHALRFWPVKKFPYLIFYVEREQHIDISRVLHAHRDIPVWMAPPDQKEEP